jgi:hypothetical protein
MIEKPGALAVPVNDPAIEGTCMCTPAFTSRTNTVPVAVPVDGAEAM